MKKELNENHWCRKCPHAKISKQLKELYNYVYENQFFWNCEKNLNDEVGCPCFCSGVKINWKAFEASLIKNGLLENAVSKSRDNE